MPGYLYTYNKFKKKLQDPILKEEDTEALKRLKTLINPFVLRRIKKDVLTELPEKNITIMKNEMTEEQQKLYMSYFVQTKKEIMAELDQNGFEKSKLKILMLLISLKAGGTGLNLTGADVVIHYDPWWNASIENQATDRAYRIGQKNSVQVYKLITNNTIEEKINKLQEKKSKLSEQLLSTEETFINKLSKEEIMALFE